MIWPFAEDYPKELYIRGRRWEIVMVGEKLIYGKDTVRGLCCFDGRKILLQKKQGRKKLLSTLVHEVLHAIEYEYNFTIPHQLIYSLEGPLAQALLANRSSF